MRFKINGVEAPSDTQVAQVDTSTWGAEQLQVSFKNLSGATSIVLTATFSGSDVEETLDNGTISVAGGQLTRLIDAALVDSVKATADAGSFTMVVQALK